MNKEKRDSIQFIFKIVLITVLIVFCFYLFIFRIDFKIINLDFEKIITLILTLFTIILSIVFYQMANSTSNRFYDNTYKFTKDVSTILRRIEGEFGEKLRHIDELQMSFISNSDYNSKTNKEIEITKNTINEEKKKLELLVKEKEKIINNLLNLKDFERGQKESYKEKLIQKDEQIKKLQTEINTKTYQLGYLDQINNNLIISKEVLDKFPKEIFRIFDNLLDYYIKDIDIYNNSFDLYKNEIEMMSYESTNYKLLKKYKIIDNDYKLTRYGFEILKLYNELKKKL